MKSYKLSFGKINKISDSIGETIVNEGVEMDMVMITEYHSWIKKNLSNPCGLLVNKVHSYTYTFKAQLNIANLPMIKYAAVVTYSSISEVATKNLSKLPRKENLRIVTFNDREIALKWLEEKLASEE